MQSQQRRLMGVLQIEDNYKKHKQRLMSIQHINRKTRPDVTALGPSTASSNYRQSHLKADLFAIRAKSNKIKHENLQLMYKIDRQMTKPRDTLRSSKISLISSRSSLRSVSQSRNIVTQNQRIYKNINNAKSNYTKFRKDAASMKSKAGSKDQLLRLLVHQFGVKPAVLFPSLGHKPKQQSTSTNNYGTNKQINMSMREQVMNRSQKRHSVTGVKLYH